jgi:hypothetical protein
MKQTLILILFFQLVVMTGWTQTAGSPIRSVKLYRSGDQSSFPVLSLGEMSPGALQLNFDDLDPRVKYYSYTFQLCNADWTPSMLHPFEYIKGFQNVRITNYRNSSIATIPYIHYQASLPDRNCLPTRSGNYLLKVYLDNDTSKLAFTKRFVVVGNEAAIAAQIQQPMNARLFRTGQKLLISVQTDNRIRLLNPSDLKVVVLQNNNWETALYIDRPTFNRGNLLEYSDEGTTSLPAGKEFRWIDLRSLRLLSDRMQGMKVIDDTMNVTVKTDPARSSHPYLFYRDLNGAFMLETMESVNPFWQADYAKVHFTFEPAGRVAIPGQDVYLFGELTNYAADTAGRMRFNEETGLYEKTLFLKQGYYSYAYVTRPAGGGRPDFSQTEGDFWGTENSYTVLVYFRPFGGRADQLVGFTTLNSAFTGGIR